MSTIKQQITKTAMDSGSVVHAGLIIDQLDVWSSAIKNKKGVGRGSSKKIDLYGINKLRYLVIELALTGALVEQSTISAESLIVDVINKKEIIGEKRSIRKTKDSFPPLELFDAPANWCWASIGELAHVLGGKRVPRGYKLLDQPTPYAYIRVTDMKGHSVDLDNLKFVDELVHNQINKYIINKEDIYVTIAGTIGAVGTIPDELDGMHLTENASKLVFDGLDKRFVVRLLSCGYVQNQFQQAVNQMAQPKLSLNSIKSTSLAIPPLDEQIRIADKVDELMALCDQLEQKQQNNIAAHKILIETLLSALTNAADKGEFNHAWTRIAEHFDTLFTTEHSIDQLKQIILQFSVMGKLVPQDPNDEPASMLLKRLTNKKSLIAKSDKFTELNEKKTLDTDSLFEIPSSWEWCYLDDIAAIARGGSPRPIKSYITDLDDGLNWIKIGDSVRGSRYITRTEQKIIKEGLVKTRQVYPGDLILSNSMSFGFPYILKISGCIHDGWLVIRTPEEELSKFYLCNLFMSAYAKKAFSEAASGAVVQNLNADKVKLLAIPLPPLKEQHRIVAKVDELMELCEQLKVKINDAQTTQLYLADAKTEQAIN